MCCGGGGGEGPAGLALGSHLLIVPQRLGATFSHYNILLVMRWTCLLVWDASLIAILNGAHCLVYSRRLVPVA